LKANLTTIGSHGNSMTFVFELIRDDKGRYILKCGGDVLESFRNKLEALNYARTYSTHLRCHGPVRITINT
jgi:hypothetical protein